MAPAARYREYLHAPLERHHARYYGKPEGPSGPGRLLANGLRTVG